VSVIDIKFARGDPVERGRRLHAWTHGCVVCKKNRDCARFMCGNGHGREYWRVESCVSVTLRDVYGRVQKIACTYGVATFPGSAITDTL